MRFRLILSFVTMALACFTLAVWTAPLPPESRANNPDDSDHRQFE
jgi:hypothetical protein